MSVDFSIDKGSIEGFVKDIQNQEEKIRAALWILFDVAAKKMEEYAQANAPWTDQTTNARQGLFGRAYWEKDDKLVLALSHSVDYGVWLELAHQRKYAILESSIKAKSPELFQACKALAGG